MDSPIPSRAPLHDTLLHGDLSGRIISAFFAAYDVLGYGYLERVYLNALSLELASRGIRVAREVPIAVWFKGSRVGQYRADLVGDDCILVEIKASRVLDPADHKQVLNYLRGTDLEVALLLHFGPKPSFQRIIMERDRKVLGVTAHQPLLPSPPPPAPHSPP
jgi:GxxExxY protein